MTHIERSADVSELSEIGENTNVWHLAQVRESAVVGQGCNIGRGAYIGPGVTVGDNCKIQNYALVYEPAQLADGVFIGPAVTLTNDLNPRAVNPDGTAKSHDDWDAVAVVVETGAAIGARAVCVAPVRIGAWSTIAAGAVVVKDVPAHALVAGVPAKQIGWVGKAGYKLVETSPGLWVCPKTDESYRLAGGVLAECPEDDSANLQQPIQNRSHHLEVSNESPASTH